MNPAGEGIYALAGGPDAEGRLPYWWMPWERAAFLRALAGDVQHE